MKKSPWENTLFLIMVIITSVTGMMFAFFAYSSHNKVAEKMFKINKGYVECLVINPYNKRASKVVWQKECQPIVYIQKNKEEKKGEKNGN